MREYGVHCARLFVRLRLPANGACDNANVTRRSHYQESLLRDNDRASFLRLIGNNIRGLDHVIMQVIYC